ncbi:hypothetical protein HJC23_007345 [Cyclotella cryptica]|uniref:Peptidase A1 domain-containing protein n=1 Tax=Cyclotella cryptica TaxID=29204 RepID=A0ABD3PDE4_9STRA|eukprot:CCRYP_015744-RA/>CCRYP_015744-RA protein AED:0.25 eAED:0.25 QI:0/-1/0/1/-1/1/1/0/808
MLRDPKKTSASSTVALLALLAASLTPSNPVAVVLAHDTPKETSPAILPAPPHPHQTLTFPLLPHHHLLARHLTEHQQSRRHLPNHAPQQLSSLYQGYGTHYIDIWVGYPNPQRQTAVVDTGSSVTAFPCSSCQNCGNHVDAPFDEARSESFHINPCAGGVEGRPCIYGTCDLTRGEGGGGECWMEHEYSEVGVDEDALASSSSASSGNGSGVSGWKAYEAEDVAYAGGMHDRPVEGGGVQDGFGTDPLSASDFSFALTFGCQTAVSGYFEKQLASGVMGLDRRAQSFWGQMRAQQIIQRAQFSLCFVRQPLASRGGTTAGAVTLGGVDDRLNLTPMVFAKTVTEGGAASFKVRVRKMYLRENGGTSVMYDGKAKYHQLQVDEDALNGDEQFDIDSGTTDTYFTKSLSDDFRRVWTEITQQEYTNDPVKLSDDQLGKLPTVILQLHPHEGGVGDEVKFDNPAEVNGLAGKIDYATPNDVMFAIPAVHYMQHNVKDGTYSARIYLDRDDAAGSILGANAMMGHNILFDIDSGRIGVAESECDYSRLVAETTGTASRTETAAAESSGASGSSNHDESHEICGSLKCKGFMGLACTVFFVLFFVFARRYVTKRDEVFDRSPELEMKSSRTSSGKGGGYSDDESFTGGERGSYRDRVPPPSYSDDRGSRSHSSHHSHSSSSRRGSNDDGSYRSSSSNNPNYRIAGDTSRGERSHHSTGGSIQSHHSTRSQRSHQSTQSNRTSSSYRSSGDKSSATRGSHGSGGSRESHRSHRSGSSHRSNRGDRYYEQERGSSSRRDRYDDYNDEISRPPSIS